jgi:hypothetical protein
VCAILKNEAGYLKEWLDYHIMIGIDKFYIYDNESDDETFEILRPYIESGCVDYKFWPGAKQQAHAYRDCYRRVRWKTRWLAFIDIDEFITQIGELSLADYLRKYPDALEIRLNWMIYGTSGHKKMQAGLLIENYKNHALPEYPVNGYVKSITNPRFLKGMLAIHCGTYIWKGKILDSAGNKLEGFFHSKPAVFENFRINHYYTKSEEEFLHRRSQPTAWSDDSNKKPLMKRLLEDDRNEVKNDTIMDRWIEKLKLN